MSVKKYRRKESLYFGLFKNEKEISIMMNICDFFILPSLYETGPQVVMEAKECQSICVVSQRAGEKSKKMDRMES